MYTGNHAVAYYLLGASIYTLLVIVLAFVAGNNQCLDKLSRNSYGLEAKLSQISTDVAEGNHCRGELRKSSERIESSVGEMLWNQGKIN